MVEEHSGYDVLGEIKINGASGTAGEALMSGGAAALPTFGAPAPATHGVAKHTDVTRELFLLALEGHAAAGTPLNVLTYSAIEGGANADEPLVFFTMKVPDDFVSFTSIKAVWVSTPAAGNMYWQLGATYGACGASITTHTDVPAIGVTATGGNGIINCQTPANALTLADLDGDDFIGISFTRTGSDDLDTLDAAMQLLGLIFTYVGHQ